MNILGIGPSELVFVLLIALIIMGPKDLQRTGVTIGRWLRRVTNSDGWKIFQQTSREMQTLPNRLMREAALDELKQVQSGPNEPISRGQLLLSQPEASRTAGRADIPALASMAPAKPSPESGEEGRSV